MLVALIIPAFENTAFINKDWGTPPGCSGYRFFPVDEIETVWVGPHHRRFRIASNGEDSFLECPLDGAITWQAEEPKEPLRVVSSTVIECTSCGEKHEVETMILRRMFGLMPLQGVAICPKTGDTIWLLPEMEQDDTE